MLMQSKYQDVENLSEVPKPERREKKFPKKLLPEIVKP